MAEKKPWYEKLLKENPNLCLEDVREHKHKEMLALSEDVIQDKIKTLEEGTKLGILKKENLENAKTKVREEAKRDHYKYDRESLAERMKRLDILSASIGVLTEQADCLDLLDHLNEDPIAAIKDIELPEDLAKLVQFFSTEFSIPKDKMASIMAKKRTIPATETAVVDPKPIKSTEPAVVSALELVAADGKVKLTVTNLSDFSHLVKLKKLADGSIHITLLQDSRKHEEDPGSQFVHSRKQIQLYVQDGPAYTAKQEFDVHTTSAIL
jgi:hypothetical protein